MRKSLLVLFALLTVLISGMAFASPTVAQQDVPANEAAELCREFDDAGELDREGITRGECVNIFMGPASENANNFIAGVCGFDFALEITETTNKGQCIKALRGQFF